MTTKVSAKTATMDTTKLREALQKVNMTKPNRTLSILSNVLVEFVNGKAILTTTNLEHLIKAEVECTNTKDFSILLPRRVTEKFLHGANGKLTISKGKEPNQIILSREGIGNFNLTVAKTDDFPPSLPKPENLEWHTIDGKWFCSMLCIIAMSCAKEESRPVLTGIACNDGAIASADGFRLSILKDERLSFGLRDKRVIIPLDTINLIIRLFGKEKILEVAFETILKDGFPEKREVIERVHFKTETITLISQLILGTFPNYEQLIPKTFTCKASFSVPLMIQRLSMMSEHEIIASIIRFKFYTLETQKQICSMAATLETPNGKAEYELTCPVKFEGQEGMIAFNHKYILDAIKPFSMCNLALQTPSSPGVVTGDIEGLTIVVMPMFVQW